MQPYTSSVASPARTFLAVGLRWCSSANNFPWVLLHFRWFKANSPLSSERDRTPVVGCCSLSCCQLPNDKRCPTTRELGNAILAVARREFPNAIGFAPPEISKKDLGIKVLLCDWKMAAGSESETLGQNQALIYSSDDVGGFGVQTVLIPLFSPRWTRKVERFGI
jgi:hypothetical protein